VPAAITAANLRKSAPGFTLDDAKGAAVKLSDYKDRVVVLDFWATWCGGCNVEIPWYLEFANKYKGSGLAVIGVSMDDDGWKSVKPFLEKTKLNYPVVIGNQDLAKRYGLESMPDDITDRPKRSDRGIACRSRRQRQRQKLKARFECSFGRSQRRSFAKRAAVFRFTPARPCTCT
jgi:peroxiredoxin